MEMKLSQRLFSAPKENIEILGSVIKQTGQTGPMGIGMCPESMREGARTPAKYSAVGKALDAILVNGTVNALCSENTLYGECNDGKSIIRFLVTDGDKVNYEGERLHGNLATLPFVLYAMRNDSELELLQESFKKVREEFDTDGVAKQQDVLLTCDIFYYGFAKKMPTPVVVSENDLAMDTVRAAVKSGLLQPMKVFQGMELPQMTGVNLGDVKGKKPKMSNEDMFANIKAGGNIIPYEWNEKQKTRIPSLVSLESFVPCGTYFSLVSKITKRLENVLLRMDSGLTGVDAIGKDYVNLFVTGKPGTGKTTLAYALGAATGMPVYTIAMTKNTEEDVFQGMNKVVDGALKFVSTDFLDAYTNGGIIILEEINLPDPSVVMGAIGQAVEFPFTLMKDGYIPVKRHPMCIIIGTMNIGTFGSKGVNQALSSRFRQSYILNDPSKEDFINILTGTGARKKDANWVFNAYAKITDYLKSPAVNAEDVCLNVTLRGCIGALENINEGEDAKDAIRNTLIGKISEVDLELAEDVYKNVVMSLPDLN